MLILKFLQTLIKALNSDGTTVRSVPREEVVYIGVTYHLRWR